jgi:hypothetical protein
MGSTGAMAVQRLVGAINLPSLRAIAAADQVGTTGRLEDAGIVPARYRRDRPNSTDAARSVKSKQSDESRIARLSHLN